MKRSLLSLLSVLLSNAAAFADPVAYWNFNNIPPITKVNVPGVGGIPTSMAVTSGAG